MRVYEGLRREERQVYQVWEEAEQTEVETLREVEDGVDHYSKGGDIGQRDDSGMDEGID